MKRYIIKVVEHIEVDGDSEDDAMSKFNDGEGNVVYENTSIEPLHDTGK